MRKLLVAASMAAVVFVLGAAAPPRAFAMGNFADDPADEPWLDHPWADERPDHYDDQDPPAEFSLGIGYSRVNFSGSPELIDGRDCLHVEPTLSVSPFERLPQLRIGAAVGWTAALDETRGATVVHEGLVVATSSDVAFMLFEPELRLSWRQPLGKDGNFFLEPGAAAGAAVGWLDVNGRPAAGTAGGDGDFSETDASFEWKVFLRAGLHVSGGIAGIEASYMRAGDLRFTDDISGEPTEFYVGIFGALQF